MKKLLSVLAGMAAPFVVQAQNTTPYIDRDLVAVGVALVAGGFGLLFILEIIKRLFAYQLKRKALELGLSEVPAQTGQESRTTIKWFAIWTGIGTGLTLVYLTLPVGIHSLAIMAFCLAASFLGYFFYLKQSRN
ncbi:hypothetical protein [Larkinella rosea]|uniref:DUF2178 domain-containing protein n=1 Tax=Larkinella rosea TaxID=2025312 RepID=A0A3P1BJ43_9BACT|nr:hypothetical protein [Larkinella rosea]RRB01140.1 hypothetical protein EHT25_23485 [Larkinella rosea]